MPLKPEALARKLRQLGFEEFFSKSGHRQYVDPDGRRTTIGFSSKELKQGTYLGILKQVGLTEEDQ